MSKGQGGGGGAHGAGGVAGRGGGGAAGGAAAKDGTVAGAGAEFAALSEGKWQPNWDTLTAGDAAAVARSDELAKSITPEQQGAIRYFTGGVGYDAIRAADSGKSNDPKALAQAQAINSALAKAKKIEQTVYRGIAVNRTQLQEIMKKKSIKLEAVSSASRDAMMARKFVSDNAKHNTAPEYKRPYGVIFKIKQRSGASIDSISHTQFEREVMLPKGMKLRVTKMTRTSVVAWEGRTPTLVIHAEEI